MEQHILSREEIKRYSRWLRTEERSTATQEKYLRDIRRFYEWLGGRAVTRELVAEWKEQLLSRRKSAATVNVALSALNSLFRFLDWNDCRARFLKIQRSASSLTLQGSFPVRNTAALSARRGGGEMNSSRSYWRPSAPRG